MVLVDELVAPHGLVGMEVVPFAGGRGDAERRVAVAARARRQQRLRARVGELR